MVPMAGTIKPAPEGMKCSASLSGAPPEAAGGRGSAVSRLALSTGSQASRRGMISGPFPSCFWLEIKNKGSVFMMAVSVVLRLYGVPLCRELLWISGSHFCAFCWHLKPLTCCAAFTSPFGWLMEIFHQSTDTEKVLISLTSGYRLQPFACEN